MLEEYIIEGMTCMNCVSRVTKSLESVSGVEKASVQLEAPQLSLLSNKAITLEKLSTAIGKYKITPNPSNLEASKVIDRETLPNKSLSTYKPLLIIVGFLLGVTLLVQYPFGTFNGMLWMRHFMAGFFLVFSFFKFLNISGFADSYSMYDIVAKRWKGWGYVYPFVELALGILYLTNVFPLATNILTIIILGVSSIGVIQSVLSKQEIKCACLGDVFNLPMSTITIIEDVTMVAMAVFMLFSSSL